MAKQLFTELNDPATDAFRRAKTLNAAISGGIIRAVDFPPMFHDVGTEEGERG
jgi:hypothetical protein